MRGGISERTQGHNAGGPGDGTDTGCTKKMKKEDGTRGEGGGWLVGRLAAVVRELDVFDRYTSFVYTFSKNEQYTASSQTLRFITAHTETTLQC